MPTVKETFDAMPNRFKSERAQGVKAVVQYDITGEGGGTYHVEIAEGTCAVKEGPAPTPQLTLTMAAQDWVDMVTGKLNPQMAFMSGKLKHKGDMSLLMRLGGMFAL
ncbi:MAG TPA: SCP2 sterol-binding domain-containing protein [Methylomirabilota bacterium]|jgi:putative sterol carrier protein|nr:SCP2 sterol-binding domain-containing protein [Methylomirabilota bacterium]